MEQERQEVYERIPWETLERSRGDRQWVMMAVAGAVAVGALAYSFMQNRPLPVEPVPTSAVVAQPVPTAPTPTSGATTPASPMVVAEADLYAVDLHEMADLAAAHAEFFAVEYFSADPSGSTQLAALLPSGVPMPSVPDGTQVFVDWVGARKVNETAPLQYEVEVVVRSLMAQGDGPFTRQPARLARVPIIIGDDGAPRVPRPPSVETLASATPVPTALVPLPPEIQSQVEAGYGTAIGGEQLADGTWLVVAMVTGADGVLRPQTVTFP